MAVSFNRAALIKAAKAALANHDKSQAEYKKAVEAWKLNHAAEWSPEKLGRLRDLITKHLRRAGNPTLTRAEARKVLGVSDVEYVFYTAPQDYEIRNGVSRPDALLSPAQVTETRALLQVLEAASGDVISANELKLLGLTRLSHVFQAAAGEVALVK
ncbi:hypothetical protein KAYACHO_47 [Mycobacterium phage KayaCho]|uniref:hypothetical protein n=1 Tax=Mycobacterium phage KayaCho TaxID=1340830 RepID=UPI000387EEFA|nr:hypothetical protein N846_gp47 [Mycobacterium phage KayaCho]AGT12951.1 hypothetical protein KAYACHO_47 [Mycobacterium phage KayaCho]